MIWVDPIKSSLAPEGPAIAFSFKEHGGIVWHGKYDLNTAELMDSITVKTTKREQDRAKLVQFLEHEDRPATAIFLLGEKQAVSNGIKQDGSMAWMQHRPQMRIRPLFADTGILRMAIANTNTRGPSLEKMRTSLPIMVPELLP